ncbi:hypothetical protein DFH09DRAFT_987921 [Mycena vulgaris]|nr:hypothetical protein DFH09DRAFT_987921 [Mycena vulgaris]
MHNPVLAVDRAALDVDTQGALQLWAAFSRCKDSLQDGRRLENLAWRISSRELTQATRFPRPLDAGWPPTPESVCSDDIKPSTSTGASSTASPFFNLTPRTPIRAPVTPAGRIICEVIPPGLTKLQKDIKKEPKEDDEGYPTPASSSSSCAGSASSSAVSIAVDAPQGQEEEAPTVVGVPRVNILTPTPNLTPHPTPPTTPLLEASPSPPRVPPASLSPVAASRQYRRDAPPSPLFLPRSATRGMGSPLFPPTTPALASTAPYAPQSTHILPLGGRPTAPTHHPGPASGRGGMFYLHAPTSSHSSSRSSNSTSPGENSRSSASGSASESSESSRERQADERVREREREQERERERERGAASARGRPGVPARGRSGSGARPSGDELKITQIEQQQTQTQLPPSPAQTSEMASKPKPARAASAPFLGGVGLGLALTEKPIVAEAAGDDARSVSSHATSSSNVRVRRRQAFQSHSRSRSRKGGTVARGKDKDRGGAPNALGLPSNLAAAAALVERTMSSRNLRRTVVVATSDEDWSDDEDEGESGEGEGESVEGGEGEVDEEGDEEWEDESGSGDGETKPTENAKAPPPSLQQHAPVAQGQGHSRVHSTTDAAAALRHLPTRPLHRTASHLPALAGTGGARHQHTASAQNARTARALKATMSETALSGVMLEAQRQRELFVKAPRGSYENLAAAAAARPGGLSLLLRPQEPQQYPAPRTRPAGGFGGLGLTMSSARPPVTGPGGAELSPIPPTPATAMVQHQNHPQQQQQQQQQQPTRRQPPPPPPPSQRQQSAAPPPRRPGIPRALSSSALPPHFSGAAGTSGSLGKSSVAGPVITSGASTSTTQNGSARSGYRPKGPPAEMEYDDDDESDADGRGAGKGKGRTRDEGLHLSTSVAQEKLRVLAERSAVVSRTKNGGASEEAERRRLFDEAAVAPWVTAARAANPSPSANANAGNHGSGHDEYRAMATAPVGFPYNLPAPAPPSTPRTTRHQMLRNEMSESLRHNLLWQRKLSRTDFIGPQPRRTKSTVNVPGAGAEGAGRQAEKSLVRVTLRAPGTERREGTLPPMDPPLVDGAPKKKLVRNLSWADTSDYHRTGW